MNMFIYGTYACIRGERRNTASWNIEDTLKFDVGARGVGYGTNSSQGVGAGPPGGGVAWLLGGVPG